MSRRADAIKRNQYNEGGDSSMNSSTPTPAPQQATPQAPAPTPVKTQEEIDKLLKAVEAKVGEIKKFDTSKIDEALRRHDETLTKHGKALELLSDKVSKIEEGLKSTSSGNGNGGGANPNGLAPDIQITITQRFRSGKYASVNPDDVMQAAGDGQCPTKQRMFQTPSGDLSPLSSEDMVKFGFVKKLD